MLGRAGPGGVEGWPRGQPPEWSPWLCVSPLSPQEFPNRQAMARVPFHRGEHRDPEGLSDCPGLSLPG